MIASLPAMTLAHPKWGAFRKRLEGPEGCNFRLHPRATWTCSSGPDYKLAKRILKAMGFDVEKSISYFREHGGYCDCEILFNVQASVQGHGRRRKRPPVKKKK
jgi:hypothetical protein